MTWRRQRAWARGGGGPSSATSSGNAAWRTRERSCSVAGMEEFTPKDGASQVRARFAEGDIVVYPNHGAGVSPGAEEKTVLGEILSYSWVYLPDTEPTTSTPADGDTGLRACA